MADNKKYYYLKLKENFYDSEEMIILQNMQDGYLYSDILMKLYLRSLKNNGKLMFKDVIPYTPSALAQVVRHQVGTVEKALKIFQQLGLIEVLDNGAIYMLDIQNFIGESSTEADRIRNYRAKIKEDKESVQMLQQMNDKSTPEIEIEIEKEIEKEIKIKKELEIEKNKKKKGTTEIDELINANFTDKEIIDTVYEFIKMRKAIKKPLTTRGLQLMIKKLYGITTNVDEQIEILNNSIMNNWQGIFPLKNNATKNKGGFDDFKEIWEEARLQDEQAGNNTDNNSFGW